MDNWITYPIKLSGEFVDLIALEIKHFSELPVDASVRALPTNERLALVQKGEVDNDLFALYFQYGRYLLIASSRPGSMAANLQGKWNDSLTPAWGSKYTIN